MAITREEFIARPGTVNKEGQLPDPAELVCVEIPKVFDQCLIKRCLVYACGPDTIDTDEELRSNPLEHARVFTGCRDFQLKLISVEKIPLKKNPSFKKLIVAFEISFYADYINCDGETKCEKFEIHRTEIIPRLYCPDSIAQVSATTIPTGKSKDIDNEIVKLELVAECLDGTFYTDDCCGERADFSL